MKYLAFFVYSLILLSLGKAIGICEDRGHTFYWFNDISTEETLYIMTCSEPLPTNN